MRFLGAISHELRLRVAALMRAVGRARAMNVPDEALDGVRRAGETLANLATDAIEVPRMEAGTLELRPGLVSVRPFLQDIVDKAQPAARDRGITVYLVVNEAAPAELLADGNRIRQIVNALLSEALRVRGTRYAVADRGWRRR